MNPLQHLLDNNKRWAEKIAADDADFFPRLAEGQQPEYLWIGCSDSRVPVSRIVDLMPGEVFVHRNIANLAQLRDLSCQSVLQFAVESLRVKHIIVCGHYGCGGVLAALGGEVGGLVNDWIGNIRNTRRKHGQWLDGLSAEKQADALCELNVVEQVRALSQNRIIRRNRSAERELALHGWIYQIRDGRIRPLLDDEGPNDDGGRDDDMEALYTQAIDRIKDGRV